MYRIFRIPQIGFIGAGNLAEALTKGFIAAGTLQIHQVWASAPTEREVHWVKQLGSRTTTDNKQLVEENQLVILGVKPQQLLKVLQEIAPVVREDHFLLSFAAGIRLEALHKFLPPKTKIARLMTNTPVQFCEGVSSFTLGSNCTDKERTFVQKLMGGVGYCTEVKEELLDTVTGFAGGGPAYAYGFMESLADAAVLGGMNRSDAIKMAAKTVLGAARMLEETKLHPGELKDAVCSGGGSTIHGIHALEKGGMRASVLDAVKAATHRSKELGIQLNDIPDE